MSILDRIRAAIERRRLRRLAPTLEYRSVRLSRRSMLGRIGAALLGGVAVWVARSTGTAGPLERFLPRDDEGSPDEHPLLASSADGHTNSHGDNGCHCEGHTNAAERHVDVASEPAHYNQVHPHMDSHTNMAHANVHTNQDDPEPHTDTGHVDI